MTVFLVLVCSVFTIILFYIGIVRRSNARKLKLPPGPPGHPLIGNLLDIPKEHLWIQANVWARLYGDVTHLNLLGQHLIFLNTEEAANDLLEKRSKIYSDRGPFVALNKMMSADFNLGFMPYGDRWRSTRRVFLEGFRKKAVGSYDFTREKRTRILLRQLSDTPETFFDHLLHFASANILETVYGIDLQNSGDSLMKVTERALDSINDAAAMGTFSLLEHFPLLRYWPALIPGGSFKRKASRWKEDIQRMNDLPFDAALKLMRADSSAHQSLVAKWLSKTSSTAGEQHGILEHLVKDAAGNAFVAGVETTASSLQLLFLAMVFSPEVQAKAHEELDRVVGRKRMPEPSDEEQLIYLKAIYKELLRWHPVVPLGIAHRAVCDDEYRGMFIPKGSLLIGNAWTMLRDENTYGPHTDEFIPERFLKAGVKDPDVGFGFGRRICPGRHFAEQALFLTIASILHVYSIDKPVGMEGRPDPKDYQLSSTLTVHPERFACSIVPRFPGAVRLAEVQSAQ